MNSQKPAKSAKEETKTNFRLSLYNNRNDFPPQGNIKANISRFVVEMNSN